MTYRSSAVFLFSSGIDCVGFWLCIFISEMLNIYILILFDWIPWRKWLINKNAGRKNRFHSNVSSRSTVGTFQLDRVQTEKQNIKISL